MRLLPSMGTTEAVQQFAYASSLRSSCNDVMANEEDSEPRFETFYS